MITIRSSSSRRWLKHCLLVLVTTAGTVALRERLAAQAQTTSNAATLVPGRFPASSLPDFSTTASAADIKARGFVTAGKDGHFHFADGSRARFWGINVSSTRLNIPNDQIEAVVANFSRAGLNIVRLEAIDNRNCLLGGPDTPNSQRFDPTYLDRIDYWMDCLRRHGIYYYLDLLDFRTFKAGDNVANAAIMARGARPYALYDRYLIQLQQDYARQLLYHRNRYSGIMPVEDPALAMIEICNEHGFFLYPEKLEALVEPYRTDLLSRWSRWLKAKYGSRDQLKAKWGAINGFNVLREDEDPDKLTVTLPLLTGTYTPLPPGSADILHAPTRVKDGVQFLAELQRAYFREMYAYLHGIGVKCPITAVVSNSLIPDISSVAMECDFTAENWYGEGQNADSRTPGFVYYSNRNSVRDDTAGGFAPFTSVLRWQNKPVVIREWATTWPNRARAVSVPEALAYASLQDYDAVLLFGYQTNRAPNGAEADALNDFAVQVDPTTWGLYGLAGQAFLRQAISPATHQVTFAYTPDSLYNWPNNATDLYRAAWSVKINNVVATTSRPDAITPTNTERDMSSLRYLLSTLGKRGVPVSATDLQKRIWRSDTDEIVRHSAAGRIEIHTPTLSVIAGEFSPNSVYEAGRLRFTTTTPFGALFAISLDGQPLEKSQHLVVKMVSRAENTDEVLERSPAGSQFPWVLKNAGKAPVVTWGRPAPRPTRVWFVLPTTPVKPNTSVPGTGKQPSPQIRATQDLVQVWLQDGTWELEVRDGNATFACDTPDIRGLALGQPFTAPKGRIDLNGLSPLPPPFARPVQVAKAPKVRPTIVASIRTQLPSRSSDKERRGKSVDREESSTARRKRAQHKTDRQPTKRHSAETHNSSRHKAERHSPDTHKSSRHKAERQKRKVKQRSRK